MRFGAAQVHISPKGFEQLLYCAAHLLPMLQGAGGVVGHPLGRGWVVALGVCFGLHLYFLEQARKLWQQGDEVLAQVLGQSADALGSVRIKGIVLEQVAVVFDHHPATRGVHDDRFHPHRTICRFHPWPPRVNVASHLVQRRLRIVEVNFKRTTANGLLCHHRLHAHRVQHPRRGKVDVGQHGRLHAAGQHEHFARVLGGGPQAAVLGLGHFGFEAFR